MTSSRPGAAAQGVAVADPAGLFYGAIVSAAALTAVSVHTPEAARVAIATVAVLVIYWMADLYVHALAARFDGDTSGLPHRLATAAAHKSSVLVGGAPGVAVYVAVYALGADATTAAFAALGTTIVLLTAAGYLGARQSGAQSGSAMIEGAGAGMLGVVIMVAKSLLH